MKSRTILPIIILISVFALPVFGENAVVAVEEDVTSAEASAEQIPPFPYIAEIVGDDVYVRSGPGTNYYFCSKLNNGDKVTVVSSKFSWSCILPPEGSFSLISKSYVSLDADDPNTGTVIGDNVRVWAGSNHRKLMQSGQLQVKLDKGSKVKLLGNSEEEYYKIVPPAGSYLYVSTRFTKPVAAVVAEAAPAVEPTPAATETPTTPETASEELVPLTPTQEPNVTGSVVPAKISVESQKLSKYYELERRIQAERAKPLEQQDYSKISEEILKIAGNPDAGKAAKYSEFTAKVVERFELALRAAREQEQMDEALAKKTEEIENAKKAKTSEIPDTFKYAVMGKFETSSVYSTGADLKRYRIVDEFGKTVCYAVPISPSMKLNDYVGKKVGLVGKIEPFPQAGSALVRFSEIAELE